MPYLGEQLPIFVQRQAARADQRGAPKDDSFVTDEVEQLLGAKELQALMSAWQQGAISRDTLLHNLRTGEVLPPAWTNAQEVELIRKEPTPQFVGDQGQPAA